MTGGSPRWSWRGKHATLNWNQGRLEYWGELLHLPAGFSSAPTIYDAAAAAK